MVCSEHGKSNIKECFVKACIGSIVVLSILQNTCHALLVYDVFLFQMSAFRCC